MVTLGPLTLHAVIHLSDSSLGLRVRSFIVKPCLHTCRRLLQSCMLQHLAVRLCSMLRLCSMRLCGRVCYKVGCGFVACDFHDFHFVVFKKRRAGLNLFRNVCRVKNSHALHRTFNVQPIYLRHENTGIKLLKIVLVCCRHSMSLISGPCNFFSLRREGFASVCTRRI